MLIKLAILKTDMEAEVSLRIFVLRCVRWYSTVNVLAMEIHAGSSCRDEVFAPKRKTTQDVMYPFVQSVAMSLIRVAWGV